jgi:hypothetical protein
MTIIGDACACCREEFDVNAVRGVFFPGLVVVVTALIGAWLSAESRVQSPAPVTSLDGAWTLNADLSDKPMANVGAREGREGRDEGDAGGRRRGGMGRGGMGGGRRGGGMGRGGMGGAVSPEDGQRMRDALRDIMVAPPHLTIVQTESQMILITTGEGRVTRLSTDGKKIKDDSTKIERRTKWDAGKLVSEISGAGPGKITESYVIDPEHHQLVVTVAADKPAARSERRVYDADPR